MRADQFESHLESIQGAEREMNKRGRAEYAFESDVFANFDEVARRTGLDRKQVLLVYLLKHIDGIASHIRGHKSQREHVSGRITDARVYLAILSAMIAEEEIQTENLQASTL